MPSHLHKTGCSQVGCGHRREENLHYLDEEGSCIYRPWFTCCDVTEFWQSELDFWSFDVVLRNNRIMWACRKGKCAGIFQHGVILAGHGLSSGWSGCHPCAGTHCVNGPFATYFDVPPVSSVCLSITPSHNYLLHFTHWTQSFLCLSANSSDVQREACHYPTETGWPEDWLSGFFLQCRLVQSDPVPVSVFVNTTLAFKTTCDL